MLGPADEPLGASSSAARLLAASAGAGESRSHLRIAAIISDMEGQIASVALEFWLSSSGRRAIRAWKYSISDAARKYASKQRAARAFVNRSLKKGWNGWIGLMTDRATALARLRSAALGFRNRSLKKGWNGWMARRAERLAQLAKLRHAARSLVFREQRKVWNKMAAGAALLRKLRKAARSLMNRNLRKGHNAWTAMIQQKAIAFALLRAAGNAFRLRGAKKAFNQLLAARAARLAKLAKLRQAARSLVFREQRKAYNKMAAGLRLLYKARRALLAMKLRNRRKGFNGWLSYLSGGAGMRDKMRGAILAMKLRKRKAAMNAWTHMMMQKARMRALLHGAAMAFKYKGLKAGYNTWAGKATVKGSSFGRMQAAVQRWSNNALVVGFYGWLDYLRHLRDVPARPRPMSPQAKLRVSWAKKRSATATAVDVPADDKYQCQRVLLAPHASLVLRADGTALRVLAVHKPPSESACTVDLSRRYDQRMLDDSPLPDYQDAKAMREDKAKPQPVDERVSAADLSAPEHPLIVPQFFGGRLELTSGLDVRVLDCEFEPSEAPLDDDDMPASPVLRRVLVSLVDGPGVIVGQPAWVALLDLLKLLKDSHVIAARCAPEDELRRRRRVELHIVEQRKLALHHLRLARAGSAKDGRPHAQSATHAPHGIEHLAKQLQDAAPSAYLDLENHAHPRADAFLNPNHKSREGFKVPKSLRPSTSSGYHSAGSLAPSSIYSGKGGSTRASPPRGPLKVDNYL